MQDVTKMINKDYTDYVQKKSPKSKKLINSLKAFLIGGVICTIAQFIQNQLINIDVSRDDSAIWTAIIMIFLGALLTALNIYDNIGKFAGAGSAVPITGFSNSIVSSAIEHKTEGIVMGIGKNMFIIAGPVLVYGITTSWISGIIYYLLTKFK